MRFMLTFMMVSLATSAAHAGDSGSPGRADSFAQGSWTATTYGSATFGADNRGNIYLAHAGVGYFVWDGVALHLEGVVGHTDAKQRFVPDSNTYGFDLLARWHFWHDETWSVYFEGGAGMIWFEHAFPFAGTKQNFTPQAGIGFTYRCSGACRLMAGVRWHHVSNASKHGSVRNPGFDGVMIYGGVAFDF